MNEVWNKLAGIAQSALRHPVVGSLLVLLGVVLLVSESLEGRAFAMVVYLSAMVSSALIVDITIVYFGRPYAELPVEAPRTELAVAAAFYVLGAATLAYRFSNLYPPHSAASRL